MGATKRAFEEMRQREIASEEITPISKLIQTPNLEINKALITEETKRIVNAVLDGNADPLKYMAYLNALERVLKAIRSGIMDEAVTEFAKYGERSITVLGSVELSQAEAGIRLDFSNTPAWVAIKDREMDIADERKELEATLKTIKKPGMISIDDELVEVNPPIRTSSTIIKVTIK